MTFEEWHEKTYHPDFGKVHIECEETAWDASRVESIKEINHLQSQIDSLMIEYCPKEIDKTLNII